MTSRAVASLLVLAAGTAALVLIVVFLWPFNTSGECGAGGGACPEPVSYALIGYKLALSPTASQAIALAATVLVLVAGGVGLIISTRPR